MRYDRNIAICFSSAYDSTPKLEHFTQIIPTSYVIWKVFCHSMVTWLQVSHRRNFGLIPGRGRDFSFFLEHLDSLWVQPTLLFIGY
jgi:hypothetical protein